MKFGLSQKYFDIVVDILKTYDDVDVGIIFGSRASGKCIKSSDVEIAVKGKLKHDTVMNIKYDYQESDLPLFVDVVDYYKLKHQPLKEHIDNVGKVCYTKNIQ